MEMADLNSVLGEVIAAESGCEREINTALQAGSIRVKMHPLSIKRARWRIWWSMLPVMATAGYC